MATNLVQFVHLVLLLLVVFPKASSNAVTTLDMLDVSTIGCADGEREWFTNATTNPYIAGCSGAWDQPGVLVDPFTPNTDITCGREAGDDGTNSAGTGCSASDLCADGWWGLPKYV